MKTDLKERLVLVRREAILDAALTTFAERGFHRSTMKDVAKGAGVAEGTIYNYFEGKTALLMALLDPLDELSPTAPPPPEGDPRRAVGDLIAQRWAMLDERRLNVLRVVLSEALVDPELGAIFVRRIIQPTLDLAEAGLPVSPAAVRAATAAFLGFAALRMMGDPFADAANPEVPEMLASILASGMKEPGGGHGPL